MTNPEPATMPEEIHVWKLKDDYRPARLMAATEQFPSGLAVPYVPKNGDTIRALREALEAAEYAMGNFVKPTSLKDVQDLEIWEIWANDMFLPMARKALARFNKGG